MNAIVPARRRAAALADPSAPFREDVLRGLQASPKTLPPKYFYDLRGSQLFDAITRLPEYYPTRTELGILRQHGAAIGCFISEGAALIEFGSGSTEKVRVLLPHLPQLGAYLPVDVSGEFLDAQARLLQADRPDLPVVPVAADFTGDVRLPADIAGRPLAAFFPGSTIGNFEPAEAEALLARFARLLGPGAPLVIGVDLVKEDGTLNAAYDDAAGVTAAFNLNLLARINRELGADFDLSAFAHRAFFDRTLSRIEMHLVSRHAQTAHVAGAAIPFAAAETIHTESSYKYTPDGFATLAARAGWSAAATFTDPAGLFAVFVLQAR